MKLSKRLENMFSAAAFAEAGEFETAREMLGADVSPASKKTSVDDVKLGTPRLRHGRLASKA